MCPADPTEIPFRKGNAIWKYFFKLLRVNNNFSWGKRFGRKSG